MKRDVIIVAGRPSAQIDLTGELEGGLGAPVREHQRVVLRRACRTPTQSFKLGERSAKNAPTPVQGWAL